MVDTSEIQDELTAVENFLTKIGDLVDWENAPEDIKAEYAEATQIMGALLDSGNAGSMAEQMAPG